MAQTPSSEADAIIRKCVHCGFCLATCPTYQLLGNELDSPRGRIQLISAALEGKEVSAKTQLHLDRCLTCRACETTCPSGVQYGRLLDIGREHVEASVGRPWPVNLLRRALRVVLTTPTLLAVLVRIARWLSPLLPEKLRRKVPVSRLAAPWPSASHHRKMLILDGCVQPVLDPAINSAAARVLDRLGISLVAPAAAGCCGAVAFHMNAPDEARAHARRNIDAWWPLIESGAEAIVVTASGCGPMLRDYAHLLSGEAAYAQKAARVSALVKDVSEVIAREPAALQRQPLEGRAPRRVAFHSPCTLQHGLRIDGVVERILTARGFELIPVRDGHLCCGSAGTYSLTQPELSGQLLARKIATLEEGKPDLIATANIGCLMHLQSAARMPVVHWIELLSM
jgi:glycolate oxidase iron-sulfur subunit